jgi:hypothetical protein
MSRPYTQVLPAQGLQTSLPGKGEWHLYGRTGEPLEHQRRSGDITLDGLLPALGNLLAHLQRGNVRIGRLLARGQLRHGRREFPDLSPHEMQKSHMNFDDRLEAAPNQTFGLNATGTTFVLPGILGRINAAEGPALPVLHIRGSIRIEDIAFVKDRFDNGFDRRKVHDKLTSR